MSGNGVLGVGADFLGAVTEDPGEDTKGVQSMKVGSFGAIRRDGRDGTIKTPSPMVGTGAELLC